MNKCECGEEINPLQNVRVGYGFKCKCNRIYTKQNGEWVLTKDDSEKTVHDKEYFFICKFCGVKNTLEYEVYAGAELRCGSCDELGVYEKGLRPGPDIVKCECGKEHDAKEVGAFYTCACGKIYTFAYGEWMWDSEPQTDPTEGRKFDQEKQRWDLVPMGTFRQIVRVLTHGAGKYAPENWKHVKDARNRYYAAAKRHIEDWWEGGTNDEETGIHLLAHACCCLLFLMWFE